MQKTCSFYTAKYLLCFINFIFFVASTIGIAIGLWLIVDSSSLISLFNVANSDHANHFNQPELIQIMGFILIFFSVVMFVISFFGYCGSIRNSRCLLMTYCILVILLLIALLAVLGFAYFNKDKVQNESQQYFKETVSNYYTGENDSATYLWNKIMTNLQCCGVEDYTDFENSSKWENLKGNRTIPEACCILKDTHKIIPRDEDCVFNPTEENSYYKTGCYEAFNNWINVHKEIFIGTLFGILLINVVAIFLGFFMFSKVERFNRLRL